MKLSVLSNYDSMSSSAAEEIIGLVTQKPDAVLCLATGDSPLGTYQHVVKMAQRLKTDFSQVRVIGLDEWVGIPPINPGSCHHYLQNNFIQPLAINHVYLFNGMNADLAFECLQMDQTIKQMGGIDLMIVGIGMNGHIGFNEPGVPTNLYAHVIELEEITRVVGQKYFQGETRLTKGITQGFQHFFESRRVLLLASGKKKASIIRRALEEPVSNQLPATLIRQHSHGMVFIDEEAGSELAHQP